MVDLESFSVAHVHSYMYLLWVMEDVCSVISSGSQSLAPGTGPRSPAYESETVIPCGRVVRLLLCMNTTRQMLEANLSE